MKRDRNEEKQFGRKPSSQGSGQNQRPEVTELNKIKNSCKIEDLSYMSQIQENSNSLLNNHSHSVEFQVPEAIIDFGEEKTKKVVKQQPMNDYAILRNDPLVNSEMEAQLPRQVKTELLQPKFQTGVKQMKKKETKILGSLHQFKQSKPKASSPSNIKYAEFQHIKIYQNPADEESSESMEEISQMRDETMEEIFSQFQDINVENLKQNPILFCKSVRSTLKRIYQKVNLTSRKVKQLNSKSRKTESKSEPLQRGIKKDRKRRKASQIERRFKCEFKKCQKGYGSSSSLSNHIHKKHQNELVQKLKKERKETRLMQPEIIDLSKRNDKDDNDEDNKPEYHRHYRFPPTNRNDEIFEE